MFTPSVSGKDGNLVLKAKKVAAANGANDEHAKHLEN